MIRIKKTSSVLFIMGISNQDKVFLYLKSNLPHYMIPAKVIKLSEFPMTPNGKIDRKKQEFI